MSGMLHTQSWFAIFGKFPLVLLDGLILSFFLAGFIENIFIVFRTWRRLPRFEPNAARPYWVRLWLDIFKMGIVNTLVMILAYFYMINFLLADTLLYGYLLPVPVIGMGVGLYSILSYKVHDWRESEIREIDRRLAPYFDWRGYETENESEFMISSILPRLQYLNIIRHYLHQMKRPFIRLWVVMAYLLCFGILVSLPYVFKVVIEAY